MNAQPSSTCLYFTRSPRCAIFWSKLSLMNVTVPPATGMFEATYLPNGEFFTVRTPSQSVPACVNDGEGGGGDGRLGGVGDGGLGGGGDGGLGGGEDRDRQAKGGGVGQIPKEAHGGHLYSSVYRFSPVASVTFT